MDEQQMKNRLLKNATIVQIATKMVSEHQFLEVIDQAIVAANKFEGVYDLFVMWNEGTDASEKAKIIKEIDDLTKQLTRVGLLKEGH